MSSNLNFIAPVENYSLDQTWADIQRAALEAQEYLIRINTNYRNGALVNVDFKLSEVDESLYCDFDVDYKNYPGGTTGNPSPGYEKWSHITGLNDNVFNAYYICPFSEEDWTVLYRYIYVFFSTHPDWFLWYGFNEWAYDAPYILRQQACSDPKWVFKPPYEEY